MFARSLRDFFANCTWHVNSLHVEACNEFLVMRWKIYDSVFIELGIFIVGFVSWLANVHNRTVRVYQTWFTFSVHACTLLLYKLMSRNLQYFLVIVANTLPVPTGIFMPAFVIGAAMGRFIGELMALGYPNGFRNDQQLLILPGIYSVVGSFSSTLPLFQTLK